jgi:translin
MQDARAMIKKAEATLSELWTLAVKHPDIVYGGSFGAALQEFAEANIFLNLVYEGKFPSPQQIRVLPADFVLGLADVIGEYRRLALDALREGDLERAEDCLKTMDEIYIELMAMDESYMLVQGLRRKCDVARKIIEATRGDVTEEIRRNVLNKRLRDLEKKLKSHLHD